MGVLDLMGYVQKQGEIGKQQGQQSRFAQLAGQAYGAAPDQQRGFVQQAIANDPTTGMALGGSLDQDNDRAMEGLARRAKIVVAAHKSGNAQMAAGMYPQLAQEAQRMGYQVPGEWNDSFLPGLEQMASAWGDDTSSIPSGLREFQGMTQGLSPEDVERARRIELGLDGRAATGGMGFQMVKNADGTESMGRTNPRTGTFEVYNAQSGQFEQLGGGQPSASAPQQNAPMGGGEMFAGLSSIPGVQVTSGLRSPEKNAQVGGVPNSYHLTDQARDIAPPRTPEQAQQIRQYAAQNGLKIIDEGDHWHLQPIAPRGASTPGLGVSRRPEDQAALTEAAKERTQLDYLPQRQQIETQGAVDRERQVSNVESDVLDDRAGRELSREAAASLPKVMATTTGLIATIDKAINHPGREAATGLSSLNPLNRLPGSPTRDFAVVMDQIKGKAFLEAFESLKGGGPITDTEGQKATDAMARLDTAQSEKEFVVALRELRQIIADGQTRAVEKVGQPSQGRRDAPASTAIRRARNPQTGEMLELRNGQWVPAQ